MLPEKASSLTEELSVARVECANLRADSDEMTALVRRLKEVVRKLLSNVATELQKTYDNIADDVKRKITGGVIDGWIKMKYHFGLNHPVLR